MCFLSVCICVSLNDFVNSVVGLRFLGIELYSSVTRMFLCFVFVWRRPLPKEGLTWKSQSVSYFLYILKRFLGDWYLRSSIYLTHSYWNTSTSIGELCWAKTNEIFGFDKINFGINIIIVFKYMVPKIYLLIFFLLRILT